MTPEGWSRATLNDLCEFRRGLTWKKEQERACAGPGRVPVLRIPNVKQRLDTSDLLWLEGVRDADLAKTKVGRGWCVIVGSNGNPNRVGNAVPIDSDDGFVFASFLQGVAPKSDAALLPSFLWRTLVSVQTRITEDVQGTTGLKNLNLPALRAYEVLIPPIREQDRIAAILSSVDDAIEATQAVIDQLGVVKKAMMADLLTRGLPKRHARFKRTEIGDVPEEWSVVPVRQIATLAAGGTPSRDNPEYWHGDVSWVKTGEIAYGVISSTEERISRLGLANSSAKVFPAGTLLMAMYGQGATRGRVALLGIEAATNQACLAIRPGDSMTPRFLFHVLAERYDDLRQLGHEGTQKNLNAQLVGDVRVPQPSIDEQRVIAAVLDTITNRIEAERTTVEAARATKACLMSVLLSGEVRVRT